MEIDIQVCDDFEVTGTGDARVWQDLPWTSLSKLGNGALDYQTQFKIAYSNTGVYFLFDCEDSKLSCTIEEDMANLFTEDVIEVFLWPDEMHAVYFEYEISPLNFELPLCVTNSGDSFRGWLPWHYGGDRCCRHETSVQGGERSPGASVDSWKTEFFIPFTLMTGMGNISPKAGSKRRANFYRIDHDNEQLTQWAWCLDIDNNFHDFKNFGSLNFV